MHKGLFFLSSLLSLQPMKYLKSYLPNGSLLDNVIFNVYIYIYILYIYIYYIRIYIYIYIYQISNFIIVLFYPLLYPL